MFRSIETWEFIEKKDRKYTDEYANADKNLSSSPIFLALYLLEENYQLLIRER